MMGEIVPVIVDTYIPFNSNSEYGVPICCKPVKKTDQWLAPIIEKAYAKQYGSYLSIDGGNSHVALYHLTGCFPIRYAMDEMKYKEMIHNSSMWKQLLKWHQQGNFLCAASKPGSDQDKNAQGIRYGHAYSILRVIEIQGNKLLQLRNPWGSGE